MKKWVSVLLTVSLILALCIPVSASEAPLVLNDAGTYYLDDGSYIVVTVDTNTLQPMATTTKTYSTNVSYYDNTNTAKCTIRVTGTFSVNTGVSVQCTDVSTITYIHDSGYDISDIVKSTTGSGNTASAIANANFVKKGFIFSNKTPVTVTVTCDKNGNLV